MSLLSKPCEGACGVREQGLHLIFFCLGRTKRMVILQELYHEVKLTCFPGGRGRLLRGRAHSQAARGNKKPVCKGNLTF